MIILCNHPEDQKSLQSDIDAFTSVHKRIPTFDEHEHLPLVMSTLKECIRIRSIAPLGLSRISVSDGIYVYLHCCLFLALTISSFPLSLFHFALSSGMSWIPDT